MKKFLLCTTVLTLTACGGGHHGSGSVASGETLRPAVSAAVAASNAQITNLPSEVVVASNGSSPVVVRSSASATSGGVTYTSYRLDDVKLFIAENFDEPPARAYINLELNDSTGEIDAVKMMVGGASSGRVVRNADDPTTFRGPIFEYAVGDQARFRVIDTGQTFAQLTALETTNGLSGGHWNRIDERMVFKTEGNTGGLNLQYADFGYFNPVYKSKNVNLTTNDQITAARNGTLNRNDPLHPENDVDKYRDNDAFNAALAKEDYQLFAGGYAIEGTTMKDTLTPENGTSYSGHALGRVYTSIGCNGCDRTAALTHWNVPYDGPGDTYTENAGRDMAKAYTTSSATLSIDGSGNQTLYMPFNTHSDTGDKFYDVTVTKTAGGVDSFDFADTGDSPDSIARESLGASQYRRNVPANEANVKTAFNPGYYGIDTPVEAAGTVRYYSEETYSGTKREWEFQGAYGMKKD